MKRKFYLDKGLIVGLVIASVLMVINVILASVLPYFTKHKVYYDSTAYVVVIFISYLIYLVRLFLLKKKSVNDVAIVLFGFFILWETSYKLGWIHNDLLLPSPEGLFHVFVEKSSEITKTVVCRFYSCSRIWNTARTFGRMDTESKGGTSSYI